MLTRRASNFVLAAVAAVVACIAGASIAGPPLPLATATRESSTPIARTPRPIVFDRPIFTIVAPTNRKAAAGAAAPIVSPHRRTAATSTPTKAAASGNNATNPPAAYGTSTIPMHRQTLGW